MPSYSQSAMNRATRGRPDAYIRTKARQCPVCGGVNRYAVADEADSPAPDGFENVPEFPGELPSAEFEFRLFDGQNRAPGYD